MPKLPEIEQAETLTTLSIIDPKNPALKPLFHSTWEPGPWNFYLRLVRSRQALTVPDLGLQTALHPASIHSFEAMRAWPNAGQAGKIAEALHATPDEIFPPWLTVFVRPRNHPNHIEIPTDRIGVNITDPADLWIAREAAREELQPISRLPLKIRTVLVLTAAGYPVNEIARAARIKLSKVREMQGVANHSLIFSL